jgi:hypothetical protein
MFDWTQARIFVITSEKIYNIKKLKIKRFILINKMAGISKTTSPNNMKEFTIHVNTEYDYRFISEK